MKNIYGDIHLKYLLSTYSVVKLLNVILSFSCVLITTECTLLQPFINY